MTATVVEEHHLLLPIWVTLVSTRFAKPLWKQGLIAPSFGSRAIGYRRGPVIRTIIIMPSQSDIICTLHIISSHTQDPALIPKCVSSIFSMRFSFNSPDVKPQCNSPKWKAMIVFCTCSFFRAAHELPCLGTDHKAMLCHETLNPAAC